MNCSSASIRVVYSVPVQKGGVSALLYPESLKHSRREMTYPEETFQVYAPSVQSAVKMVDRVFNGVVLSNEINQSGRKNEKFQTVNFCTAREKSCMEQQTAYWLWTMVVEHTSSSTSGSPLRLSSATFLSPSVTTVLSLPATF